MLNFTSDIRTIYQHSILTLETLVFFVFIGYPGPPTAPRVVSAFKDCINLSWPPPSDTGGTKIIGYNLERNKKGTNYWTLVNQKGPITGINNLTSCRKVNNELQCCASFVIAENLVFLQIQSMQWRMFSKVRRMNLECLLLTCLVLEILVFLVTQWSQEIQRVSQWHSNTLLWIHTTADFNSPICSILLLLFSEPPGKITELMLTSSTYTTFSLSWTKPKEIKGVEDEAEGYYVEIRPIESLEWTRCNAIPIIRTSYTMLGLKAMAPYWVRVIATNYGGDGEPLGFNNYITAMPPPGENIFKWGMWQFAQLI